MIQLKLLVVVSALLAVASCGSESVRDSTGKLYQVTTVYPDPDFAGSLPVNLIVDKETLHYYWGRRRVYSVVPIWTQVFSTDERAEATLTITKSSFSRAKEALTYAVVSELSCGDESFAITGSYEERSTLARDELRREVVQEVVKIVAEEVLAKMKECERT